MHRLSNRTFRAVIVVLAFFALAIGVTSCKDNSKTQTRKSAASEAKARDFSYNGLVAAEPAHPVTNPKNRKTVNFYIDTWNKPGQLAYTYLQNASGQITGYYVLDGPPVSMCTALTPPERWVDIKGDGNPDDVEQKAPGIDGVWYSGNDCARYYGKDVTSGAYVEFSVGQSQNMLLYTQPLSGSLAGNAKPLGPTSVDDVKK